MGVMFTAEWWQRAWPLATQKTVRSRAFRVALVVGTVLTLINQGDVILHGDLPDFWKTVLTYCVPYLVNTHGAVTAQLGL